MAKHTTIVVRMPEDEAGREAVRKAFELLKPYQTGMSLEDEMTILEMIEQHPDFEDYIAEEAREQAAALHATVEV